MGGEFEILIREETLIKWASLALNIRIGEFEMLT